MNRRKLARFVNEILKQENDTISGGDQGGSSSSDVRPVRSQQQLNLLHNKTRYVLSTAPSVVCFINLN